MNPVHATVAELDRTLRGPARLKRCLLAEVRHGLDDAVAAHREAGLDEPAARARAAAEFGTAPQIAPLLQRELMAAQVRRTALLLALAFPGLLLGWDLMWHSGVAWSGPATPTVRAMAQLQDLLSGGIGVGAVLVLLVLARGAGRSVDPGRHARVVGQLGTIGVLSCGGTALAMNLMALPQTVQLITTTPFAALAYLVSAAVLVAVARSLRRTQRLARLG